jgi:predicted aconitase with swiveling domain
MPRNRREWHLDGSRRVSSIIVVRGRAAYPGVAQGEVIISHDSIPGWGVAFDLETGAIIEPGNSLYGQSIKGKVLILNGSRGSTGFATQFHKVRVAGVGPIALIIPRIDSRTGVTCVVSRVPAVTDLEEDILRIARSGDRVTVDGDQGIVRIDRPG